MKRILFIDDEPMVLQGLKSKLYRRRGDWDLSFAEGGVEGVASLQKDNFDVIVTDLRMPWVDGVQVLKEAREHRPGAIRIVFSGSTDDQQTARLLSLAQQYLNKPCEPGRLEQMIERCFATQMLIGDDAIRARIRADHLRYGRTWCPHTATAAEAWARLPDSRRAVSVSTS